METRISWLKRELVIRDIFKWEDRERCNGYFDMGKN